jgi:hypothetical protein
MHIMVLAMTKPAEIVYILCALTSFACAALLWRAYLRSGTRLLFWSAVCFGLLTIDNVLLYIDLAIVPTTLDLRAYRTLVGLIGFSCLLYGLIWELDRP